MLNVMLWVVRSGAPWCALPGHSTLAESGNLDEVLKDISLDDIDEEKFMIDATIVCVHQHGSAAKKGKASRRSNVPMVE